MSCWITLSFAVPDPAERARAVRPRLPLGSAAVGATPVILAQTDRTLPDGVCPEILALSTEDVAVGARGGTAYDIRLDELAVFGPYMDAVLRPGEYGAVLRTNDTSNRGDGVVYRKRGDGVAVVDRFEGAEGEWGEDVVVMVAEAYGFAPSRDGDSDIVSTLRESGDPFPLYRDALRLERRLSGESGGNLLVRESLGDCPDCGAALELARDYTGRYRVAAECPDCGAWLTVHDPTLLPDPGTPCPDCGGSFERRALQYPSLASTAFECADCGAVTFDTHALDADELAPDATLDDAIGPDVAAITAGDESTDERSDSDPGERDDDGPVVRVVRAARRWFT